MVICVAWFTIDSMFELGQRYGHNIFEYLPQWFGKIPMSDIFRSYFINGVFDVIDLLAIGFGSITAFIIGQTVKTERRNANA